MRHMKHTVVHTYQDLNQKSKNTHCAIPAQYMPSTHLFCNVSASRWSNIRANCCLHNTGREMRERRVNVFRGKETQKRVSQRRQVPIRRRSRMVRVVHCVERDERRMCARLLYGFSSVRERLCEAYSMSERGERGRVRRLEGGPCLRIEEVGRVLCFGGRRCSGDNGLWWWEGF